MSRWEKSAPNSPPFGNEVMPPCTHPQLARVGWEIVYIRGRPDCCYTHHDSIIIQVISNQKQNKGRQKNITKLVFIGDRNGEIRPYIATCMQHNWQCLHVSPLAPFLERTAKWYRLKNLDFICSNAKKKNTEPKAILLEDSTSYIYERHKLRMQKKSGTDEYDGLDWWL